MNEFRDILTNHLTARYKFKSGMSHTTYIGVTHTTHTVMTHTAFYKQ